jgi:hypothetical protein
MLGTAGATLLALLFVAVSLGAGYLTEEHRSATRMFMSPVVVHFTSVFFLSAIALFPWHQAKFFAALIGATAFDRCNHLDLHHDPGGAHRHDELDGNRVGGSDRSRA